MTYESKKRWLMRYREAVRLETELSQEIETLKTEATRITPLLSGTPGSSGGTDKLPRAVERIEEAQQQLQSQIDASQIIREEIESTINAMSEHEPKEILRRRYLLGQRWATIADTMAIDSSWMYRLHKRAVVKLKIPNEKH